MLGELFLYNLTVLSVGFRSRNGTCLFSGTVIKVAAPKCHIFPSKFHLVLLTPVSAASTISGTMAVIIFSENGGISIAPSSCSFGCVDSVSKLDCENASISMSSDPVG